MTRWVAVTGAAGFVGRALVARLLDEGYGVRALVHRTPLDITHPALECVTGGLGEEAALSRLVEGAEVVVHVAGVVRGRAARDFLPVNAEGVARVARIVGAQPVPPRMILISSLAARAPYLSHYAASKREGEARLAQTALDHAILRPPAIYGPGDKELVPLFEAMARGIVPLPGGRGARASLLHVDDLARAILALIARPAPGTFELHDGRAGGYGWEEIAAIVEQVSGRGRGWRVPLPGVLLHGVATVNLFAARLFGYQPMLSPGKVRELRHPDWVADNAALSAVTGWQPQIPLAEGLCGLWGKPRPQTEKGKSHVI
ncbi:NAD-dependent epimerase/dehydratase family protein [Roseovarius autotrophicus]|uniref:NAD-dependent epimerase/dehydratase family protein n=1 Tax=Roseovarius autotrophicus TaxID=2824121 RepID=UPI001A0D6BA7|nr:NAD(P)-dependent oxidoreductase [Roseovarius autotrophicus]MBE0454873.1 NAD(P)-dependent oxidoreductase [Roseovarius sp.]